MALLRCSKVSSGAFLPLDWSTCCSRSIRAAPHIKPHHGLIYHCDKCGVAALYTQALVAAQEYTMSCLKLEKLQQLARVVLSFTSVVCTCSYLLHHAPICSQCKSEHCVACYWWPVPSQWLEDHCNLSTAWQCMVLDLLISLRPCDTTCNQQHATQQCD